MQDTNRVCQVFDIQYPIIAGGMVWCSGWELTAAVSNAGGLGLIGSASMTPDVLRDHIRKCKAATDKPFGVNVAIGIREKAEDHIKVILEEKVPIVFTSAGNPRLYTKELQANGIKVAHVVPSLRLALKCAEAGVDAVVAEGFEAGGHNGFEEIAVLPLIPHVRAGMPQHIPLIAAGGIASGQAIAAVFALGAEGVQLGTRFAVTQESSCSQKTKERLVAAMEGETHLTMKQVAPARLLMNEFGQKIRQISESGASKEEVMAVYGKHNTRRGLFDGDVDGGEIDIGQVVADVNDIPTVAELMERLVSEFNATTAAMAALRM